MVATVGDGTLAHALDLAETTLLPGRRAEYVTQDVPHQFGQAASFPFGLDAQHLVLPVFEHDLSAVHGGTLRHTQACNQCCPDKSRFAAKAAPTDVCHAYTCVAIID